MGGAGRGDWRRPRAAAGTWAAGGSPGKPDALGSGRGSGLLRVGRCPGRTRSGGCQFSEPRCGPAAGVRLGSRRERGEPGRGVSRSSAGAAGEACAGDSTALAMALCLPGAGTGRKLGAWRTSEAVSVRSGEDRVPALARPPLAGWLQRPVGEGRLLFVAPLGPLAAVILTPTQGPKRSCEGGSNRP